ncbi:MAG: LPS export ABC transporter periplasmic protein LptC [Chitinivibrionales bacterium]|nr:LPS export ABC transporter periplasmic protein LptC [Chitinivibrionales bacterium]
MAMRWNVQVQRIRWLCCFLNRCITGAIALALVFSAMALTVTTYAQPQPLDLVNADNNENFFTNGKLIHILRGNVQFKFEDLLIRSDTATWYRDIGKVLLQSNVVVRSTNQELTCDKMELLQKSKKYLLNGNIRYLNKKEQIQLTSQQATYQSNNRTLYLSQQPHLLYFDTAAAETLSIQGKEMFYDDSLQIARAVDSVVVAKNKLSSSSRTALYNNQLQKAFLRGTPIIAYDNHRVSGDSIDLFFKEKRVRGISVMRNGRGIYRDTADTDTIITRITGDSLYMDISDSGTIETIWAFTDASAFHYTTADSLTMNEAHGKTMAVRFGRASTAKGSIAIAGNALSTYYVNDKNEKGKNDASGDSITIDFSGGRASFITLSGAVRGTYFVKTIK